MVHYSRHASPGIPFAKSNTGIANHQLHHQFTICLSCQIWNQQIAFHLVCHWIWSAASSLTMFFFQIHNRTIRLSAINGSKASNTQTTHWNWNDSSWLIVDYWWNYPSWAVSFSKAKSMAKAIQLLDDDLLSLLDISALAWNGTLWLINKSCAEWCFLLMHCWHVPYTFKYIQDNYV